MLKRLECSKEFSGGQERRAEEGIVLVEPVIEDTGSMTNAWKSG